MRKTNKKMREDFFLTRKIIYFDNEEYYELKDNNKRYLYSEWDRNRGIKYIPKHKRKGSK